MKIVAFRKGKTPLVNGNARDGGDGCSVEVLPYETLNRTLPKLSRGSLVYIDVEGLSQRELSRRVSLIREYPHLLFGFIDFKGQLNDPSSLFHLGAMDILGKHYARVGLTMERLREVVGFARSIRKDLVETRACEAPGASNGWAEVRDGREYRFLFLFVEADDAEELKKRYGQEDLYHAMETFRCFVERGAAPFGGRLWMWSQFGGVVLFRSGEQDWAPAVCAFRLMLTRPFYEVEESLLPNFLSFRMALSIGSMAYREKKTGGIVSDSLNFLFHLGQKFSQPGWFTVTEDVLRLAPDPLKEYAVLEGEFEGRKIYRMRAPVFPAPRRDMEWSRQG